MNLLTNQINHKYGISMPGEGLIKQLKIVTKKENVKWHELFISETKELLLNESDKKGQYRFKQIIEKKILKYFDEIPKYIDSAYFINLNQINRQIDDWHGVNLPLNQIELFKIIKDAILKESTIQTYDKIEMNKKTNENIIALKMLIKNER